MNTKIVPLIVLGSILCSAIIVNKSGVLRVDKQETVFAETKNYTVGDFCNYLEDKREHYPLSDEFIERYQQTSGGYIDYAKQCGIPVDKTIHSPNQKWHFFKSWIEYGEIDKNGDAKSKIYTNLKCPELLLWIYEAMGANPIKVKAAKEVAEQGKVNSTNVATIAKNMRACVSWEDLIINLE